MNAFDLVPVARRVTLYFRQDMIPGVCKVEASAVAFATGPHAQYQDAVHVAFVPRWARRTRALTQTSHASLLILAGWGHPDPDGLFLREQPSETPGVTVAHGRYRSCDPRWQSDFDARIKAHIKATGATVVADFRGHDSRTTWGRVA